MKVIEKEKMNIYFKGIKLINPAENVEGKINLWIKDGIIKHCENSECPIDSNTEIIDGKKLVASPGLIDIHVHFREPGYEYKEDLVSGSNSAANGGFTEVVVMPNTSPDIDDVTVIEYIKSKSKDFLVNVRISGAITKSRAGELLAPMLEMKEAGALMFTDDGTALTKSDIMRLAFEYATPQDLLLSQHCEDTHLTKNFSMNESSLSYKLGLKGYPNIAEEIILMRDILLAEYLGNRRYHAQHLSTAGAVKLVRDAKARGLRVSCEVTPHHFVIGEENLTTYDSNYKMNPPLRQNSDINAIIEGLIDGTIDCIASDHAPHALHEKDVELEAAPNGIIGLETSLGLALTYLYHAGHLSLSRIIELMAINPRKILGLEQIKIKAGEPANITVFDPESEWIVEKIKFASKSKNTPFNGFKLQGKPVLVVNNNKLHKSNL